MDLLLNELSLDEQFKSIEDFCENAIPNILNVFKDLQDDDLVFKKYDLYARKVTPDQTIHEVLTGNSSRMFDELRKFKVYLSKVFEDPYWEEAPKHSTDEDYSYQNNDIKGMSLAESCERDLMVISFMHNDFLHNQLVVNKNNTPINIENLTKGGDYFEACWRLKKSTIEEYCCNKYNDKSKLNFSFIDEREGFNLLKSNEDIELFKSGFEKFNKLTWQQVGVDDGLDYKPYDKKNFYKEIRTKKHKFRISQKYRCFGFVENGVFNVLCFDLTHKLSD